MEPRTRFGAATNLDTIAPNSMKTLGENKIRAFDQGHAGGSRATLSRREKDDRRAKMEANETEEVLKEFVAAFDEPTNKSNKTFIKGGVFNPGSHEETPVDRGKTYRSSHHHHHHTSSSKKESSSSSNRDSLQQQIAKSNAAALAAAAALTSPAPESKPKIKNDREKRKSNLESFKEELKRIQEERDRRHAQKQREKDGKSTRFEPPPAPVLHSDLALDSESLHHESRYASDDPNTTNLFLNTLPRSMNEINIMELFGRYGPLASVKIMYPRSDEEKSRGTNCGFVAYMSRKDAERAMQELDGNQLEGIPVRMSWGRAVHIPLQPVYIPPTMREFIMPPPPSGLPFNAQPNAKYRASKFQDLLKYASGSGREKEFAKLLEHATVRVIIPHDRSLLCLIHRMIEFVVREGPLFEALIMSREMNNPQYRFLFDNQSPAHTYYRWKLYSVLQGDSISSWRFEPFRLFHGGSLWVPPQPQQFTSGMPDEMFEKIKKESENETGGNKGEIRVSSNAINTTTSSTNSSSIKRGRLSHRQRDHLEDLLRSLTPERNKIGDAMLWAIDHADSADEIIDCLTESLSISQTPVDKKISRLYLISDILHNCSVKVTNASHYRRGFEGRLPDIFSHVHETWSKIDGRLRAEQFKQKVMSSFRAWESWAIYPSDYLIKLQNIFLGLVRNKATVESSGDREKKSRTASTGSDEDIDGKPVNLESSTTSDNRPLALVADYDDEEDIDGKPISAASTSLFNDDIDGRPLDVNQEPRPRFFEDAKEQSFGGNVKPRFVPTKWETIDPSRVAAQAVTTSKWDFDQDATIKVHESLYEDLAETTTAPSEVATSMATASNDEKTRTTSSIVGNDNGIFSESVLIPDMMSEERRQKLREIEVKVLKFTDELESGRRERMYGLSLAEEVEFYRQNLLKKAEDEEKLSTNTSPDQNKSISLVASFSNELRASNTVKPQSESSSSRNNNNNNSSRYLQQRSTEDKNQEASSRRDESSSRHKSGSTRSNTGVNSSSSNQSDSTRSSSSSSSRTVTDHYHHQHKRKRDERSPSPSSRHTSSSRSSRR